MGLLQAYKMAIRSIFANKARSFLTMLGVIIGVGSVISAVGFAQGSTKSVTDTIQNLGTNLIQITLTGRGSNRNVTSENLSQFAEENSGLIDAVAPTIQSTGTIKFGNKSVETTILGTNSDYAIIKDQYVQSGRYLSYFDNDFRLKTAVMGTAVVNELFGPDNPIGQNIKINGQLFEVVGILEEKEEGQEGSSDDQIIIPVTTAQRMMRMASIRTFSVQASEPEKVDKVIELLEDFLYEIYNDINAYRVMNQALMMDMLDSITGIMTTILAGIATISLVVGGIGIMNIMLVSVTERTREIGIRKAVGAKKRSIMIQFLIEALMVTGIGGIIGILLGIFVIKFILAGLKLVPPVYSIEWISLSFGISLFVGVVFGIFPAYKAANLSPIQALRHE